VIYAIRRRDEFEFIPFWEGIDLQTVFTARRNNRIASAVLASAIPSVRLSVTRRYCVKTTERRLIQFALSDSRMCLVL